jgi:DNA polymerase III subunit gamma/tau
MAYLVLARKYRPQTFEDVIAQSHVTRTLQNAITSGRVAHAILFAGPRGTGKTTVARILAKAMNCEKGPTPTPCNVCRSCMEITAGHAGDVSEIDGASNNSVDQVRELRDHLKYLPTSSRFRIYIIDEVHMLSTAAFNALLKTLEEPPAHVLFMFATTEPHKIPITILSRCQRHDMRRIDLTEVSAHLQSLTLKEGILIPTESLWLIARESEGSMRDALSLLDQVMAFSVDGAVSHEAVVDLLGVIDRQTVFDLSDAVFKKEVSKILEIVETLYNRGIDLKKAYGDLLRHVRDLMVVKLGHAVERLVAVTPEEIRKMRDQVQAISAGSLSQLYELLFGEENTLRYATQPRIAFEMALIKIVQIEPTFTLEELIQKLDALRTSEPLWQTSIQTPASFINNIQSPGAALGQGSGSPATESKINGMQPQPLSPIFVQPTATSTSETVPEPTPKIDVDPFKDLDRTWGRIRRMVTDKAHSLEVPLSESRINIINDNSTVEVVVRGAAFAVSIIADKQALIKEAAEAAFGKPMGIAIRSDGSYEANQTESRKRREQLEREVRSHPMVAVALEQFRGKIIDIKIPQEDTTYEGHGIHDETGSEITEPDAEDAGGVGSEDS